MNENEQKKWIEAEKKRVKAEIKQRMMTLDSKPQGYIKSEPSDMPQVNAPAINPLPQFPSLCEGATPSKLLKAEDNYFDIFSDIMVTKPFSMES